MHLKPLVNICYLYLFSFWHFGLKEDEKIRMEVERYKNLYPNQQISWKFIEEAIQNRTAKQCRER